VIELPVYINGRKAKTIQITNKGHVELRIYKYDVQDKEKGKSIRVFHAQEDGLEVLLKKAINGLYKDEKESAIQITLSAENEGDSNGNL
jgi:hypothetical protein